MQPYRVDETVQVLVLFFPAPQAAQVGVLKLLWCFQLARGINTWTIGRADRIVVVMAGG
jgi:hypothetical protein